MDDSGMAEGALRYALEAHPDAEVTVLTVVGEPSGMFERATAIALADDPEESAEEYARPVFERAREIVDRTAAFDTVVIESHGGALADRLFVGNVAETVFRRSPVPVTVVR